MGLKKGREGKGDIKKKGKRKEEEKDDRSMNKLKNQSNNAQLVIQLTALIKLCSLKHFIL